MLYLIGLGLNIDGISKEGMEIIKRCKRIYLETYTVEFPYSIGELSHELDKKIFPADREFVESLKIVDEAKKQDVILLIYGSPLFATTHITLLQEALASKVKCKVIYNASVFDALGETGLQLYKFGKITSLPNLEANSYLDVVKDNLGIDAHSLILVDIGMKFSNALEKLEMDCKNKKLKIEKILVCSKMGSRRSKILYDKIENLKDQHIEAPFCFIVPGKLHFLEKEILESI